MKDRKVPVRRCVGCMKSREKAELLRIAMYENEFCVDETGRAKGRGIYVCRESAMQCLEAAIKKRIPERSLSRAVSAEEKEALRKRVEEVCSGEQSSG